MKICFNSVTKTYGAISALKDISFEIKSGEFVFVVGPSGSGKTTILKLILNQIKPTSGDITLGEIVINRNPSAVVESVRRKIGAIFQDYQLIRDQTISENIAIALDIVSYPIASRQEQIDKVIEQVGLATRRHLFPSQLSGGELQRASLARALAINPQVILADEPTGNLDPENSWNLIKLLSDINASGTTVIMTTHNLDIIQSMNKRIIAIKNGHLLNNTSPPPKIAVKSKTKNHARS